MIEDQDLNGRVAELEENLTYYLRNYNRLIANGFRKSVLDSEIESVSEEIKFLSRRDKLL